MLNIYYGRESIDKEKFIYESIGKTENTLVLVPDQYTLEAEKEAFHILGGECLMNMEILSISRLGSRILKGQGSAGKTFIDKYGRHMLLSHIMGELESSLQVFRGVSRKNSFIEMVNNFISEMKQYNVTPEALAQIETSSGDGILAMKLKDLRLIFEKYEEKIKDNYTDTEDYIELYKDRIGETDFIKNSTVWIYGFDSFAPKAVSVIGQLMVYARNVNVVLTYDENCLDEDIFTLSAIVMKKLEEEACALGIDHRRTQIDDSFLLKKNNFALETVEKQLFAITKSPCSNTEGLTLVESANPYNEAESAASYILHLVRDKGLRYRDIVVICGDIEKRASIINRVFAEYGLDMFDDRKRSVLNSPIAIYVVALLECVVNRFRTADIFKVLKTGFSGLSDSEVEQLENYAYKYRIKGTMWARPFTLGVFEYGNEGLDEIEAIRKRVVEPLIKLQQCLKGATYEEFTGEYYRYLAKEDSFTEKIEALAKAQEEQELFDLAEETRQIWNYIAGLLDQIVQLLGADDFDGQTFIQLLTVGLSQLEVGVLPQSMDSIMLGTMQRTRSARVKAVLVLGANEGIIPASGAAKGLFSVSELEQLAEEGREICKVEKVRVLEEKLAIYRNLSKPTDFLWIGFCSGDTEGNGARPSEIINEIKRIFPDLTIERDILNRDDMLDMVGGQTNTLRHLAEAVHRQQKGEKVPEGWSAVMKWYKENHKDSLDSMLEGFSFTNRQENLPYELVERLYKRDGKVDLSLSPSRMERFSRCPFSHFIMYGLKPDERRIFETGSREIGDVYHACLMRVSEILEKEGTWNTIEPEECRRLVSEIVADETGSYREGVFQLSNEEKYKTERLEENAFTVCWELIGQVRQGKISSSMFEADFGRMGKIKPIQLECHDGTKLYIEGKIDRVDTLSDESIKIIDYKTGKEEFSVAEARGGYRLQLMTYLKAAQEGKRRPAGVFYFLIDEPRVDITGVEKDKISEKISKEIRKSFKLNGIMVNDSSVIADIAGDFDGYSDVVPLRKLKNGTINETGSDFLLSPEDFARLQDEVDAQLQRIADEFVDGRIEIKPKKTDKTSPCVYCRYKGICRFDVEFKDCNYEII